MKEKCCLFTQLIFPNSDLISNSMPDKEFALTCWVNRTPTHLIYKWVSVLGCLLDTFMLIKEYSFQRNKFHFQTKLIIRTGKVEKKCTIWYQGFAELSPYLQHNVCHVLLHTFNTIKKCKLINQLVFTTCPDISYFNMLTSHCSCSCFNWSRLFLLYTI